MSFDYNAYQAQFPSDGNYRDPIPRIICTDGFSVSVQASGYAYCSPRMGGLPDYYSVEAGFPSAKEDALMPYAEDADKPTGTVYGYVPVDVINAIVAAHGGILPTTGADVHQAAAGIVARLHAAEAEREALRKACADAATIAAPYVMQSDTLPEMVQRMATEVDALRKDAARLDAIESGEVDIECMGTTVRYFNLHSRRGKCVTASPSDSTPLTLRAALDAALAVQSTTQETTCRDCANWQRYNNDTGECGAMLRVPTKADDTCDVWAARAADAGMARSGSVYPLDISPDVLMRAFQNTVELLKANVEVIPTTGAAHE